MAFTHTFTQVATTPVGALSDAGVVYTADTVTDVDTTVDAFGGSANAVAIAFTAAGLQSLVLLASVNCVVSLTGATVIDGITIGTVTLTANVIRQVTAITGNVSAISVGANTTGAGPAGTIKLRALFNS